MLLIPWFLGESLTSKPRVKLAKFHKGPTKSGQPMLGLPYFDPQLNWLSLPTHHASGHISQRFGCLMASHVRYEVTFSRLTAKQLKKMQVGGKSPKRKGRR